MCEELKQYPGVISPDCSLYIDAPRCAQICTCVAMVSDGYR
ncbi:DUF4417 domain-containing protein [Gardnerella vaginalis]